ncbi:MAG: glycoside hydrolase family 9 protein [Lachnospiraceae bacterium]|nr:glycoside hydrolase family 9 protein [Lachnospiraceae bacterium]
MIALNQVGYLTDAVKKAVLTKGNSFQVFQIVDGENKAVLEKKAEAFGMDEASQDEVSIADFSEITQAGIYFIKDNTGDISYRFAIGDDIYQPLQKDLLKALYYQRCGCALEEKHAGVYTHACCHTGEAKLWENHEISKEVNGGWHDAGDFGRYISPAAVAVAHLLYAYMLFPESFQEEINIPESGNGVPDILNECRYELEWMLKMQDEEGGAYHKLTSAMHADFMMPEEDKSQFYLFPVSSMATADYAASMALASRVYAAYDKAFADKMMDAAKKAWSWLEKHPEYIGFKNPENCNTGEYDDVCDKDERLWAAAEMFVATGEGKYQNVLKELCKENLGKTDFGWTDVSGLASMAILTDAKKQAEEGIRQEFRDIILAEADRLVKLREECGYMVAMKPEDYVWGSNMVVLNRAMLMVLACTMLEKTETDEKNSEIEDSQLKMQKKLYENTALAQMHYLLGTNAVGYSYVTGYGENAYKNPHNRPTECDGIELPMAGWVSGGPSGIPYDETAIQNIPQGTPPMKCYLDHVMCYSLNEITIYWNSPAVFVTAYFNR